MEITKITDKNRNEINDFIKKQWFSTTMAIRGELFDMAVLPGFVCYENNEIIGYFCVNSTIYSIISAFVLNISVFQK